MRETIRKLWYTWGAVIVWGTIALAVVTAIGSCVWWVAAGTSKQLQAVEDPTERGLMYVAVAIMLHAFFGGSSVTVKDGKKG